MPAPLPDKIDLELTDGRLINCQVRRSQRAQRLRISVCERRGLSLILPGRGSWSAALAFLHEKRGWIERQLTHYESLAAQKTGARVPALPDLLELPAIDKRWVLDYQNEPGLRLRICEMPSATLRICGPLEPYDDVYQCLRAYLRQSAHAAFPPWLAQIAQELGITYERLLIRSQRSRWGSCTSRGTITLNDHLLFLPDHLVRHVMIHELCHRLEANHSARFWSLVNRHDPATPAHRQALREAIKIIPPWARAA